MALRIQISSGGLTMQFGDIASLYRHEQLGLRNGQERDARGIRSDGYRMEREEERKGKDGNRDDRRNNKGERE
jgi:hypothetical protein